MNEIIFFIQILIVVGFAYAACKLGQGALTTWVTVQAILANLFVIKQVTLFGFEVTASDAFSIGSLLGLNFLQEYFSKEEAKKATWICFFFLLFFALVSKIHLLYQASPHDVTQSSFIQILSPAPRLLVASMCVFLLVQQIDMRLFVWLKNRWSGLDFASRVAASLIISQFLDTVLFSFFGLYGLVTSVFNIILFSFIVKLSAIFCALPFLKWIKA